MSSQDIAASNAGAAAELQIRVGVVGTAFEEKVLLQLFLPYDAITMPMEPKDWIDVTTEKNHYSLDHFVIPKHYEKDVSSILIPHGVIMVSAFFFLISQASAGK